MDELKRRTNIVIARNADFKGIKGDYMTKLRWLFMNKEDKLLYNIRVCFENKQNLHLKNGLVLNFSDMAIKEEGMDAEWGIKYYSRD